jgi:hypothetical protein
MSSKQDENPLKSNLNDAWLDDANKKVEKAMEQELGYD